MVLDYFLCPFIIISLALSLSISLPLLYQLEIHKVEKINALYITIHSATDINNRIMNSYEFVSFLILNKIINKYFNATI